MGSQKARKAAVRYASVAAASIAAIVVCLALQSRFPGVHLELLLLSCAVVASALWGRGPGAVAALLVALGYDWFFLPPYHTLRVEPPYIVSLVLFLVIALVVGQLAARLRKEARAARREELRARVTASLARELSGALTSEQVLEAAREGFKSAIGQVPSFAIGNPDPEAAPPGEVRIPLRAPRKIRGHLSLSVRPEHPADLELAETLASVVALSLERIHFVDVAREALVRMEGEKMRGHVLSTLSHDLRTPLTGIVAGAQGLESDLRRRGLLEEASRAESILEESRRMADLVANLLELSRLQSGGVKLRCDWNDAEELFGSAIGQRRRVLSDREIRIDIPAGCALFWCDGLLVERVLVNLLDNAARHTPAGTPLRLWAESSGGHVRLGLDDEGPGFPSEQNVRDAGRGGIGLSLCRSIAKAHGGELTVQARPEGGSRVFLSLPADRVPPTDPSEA